MDIKLYCWLNRWNQKASWNISNVVFVSAVKSQHWLVTEDLLFTVIAFKEGLLPKLNFLLLLNFLPHSQLQLRSEFSCGENEVCYLITLQKKRKRETGGHEAICFTWRHDFECGAVGCQRLHWPSASLSFHDCAADVKNSLFRAELVTFRRPSMEAWGEKGRRYGTPDIHAGAFSSPLVKKKAFTPCTWWN